MTATPPKYCRFYERTETKNQVDFFREPRQSITTDVTFISMAGKTTSIPKLNDSNYWEWAIRMKAYLKEKELWKVIDVTLPSEDRTWIESVKAQCEALKKEEGPDAQEKRNKFRDALNKEKIKRGLEKERELGELKKERNQDAVEEARAQLILHAEASQLSLMRSLEPMEIWSTLKRVYLTGGCATNLALRRRLLTMKKTSSETMQKWIDRVKAQACSLEERGIEVPEEDIVIALTMGLPDSYKGVVDILDAMPKELLTLNNVTTGLLHEEARQVFGTKQRWLIHDPDGEVLLDVLFAPNLPLY